MAVNYNIIDKSINTALDNFEISGGKTYIILLEAPTGANVRIRLDDNTADEIPLDTNYGLKFSKATRIYVSADAVSGQAIKIGVSDTTTGEFEVLPSPTVDQIDTIGEVTTLAGISSALNTALDKIINPYNDGGYIYGTFTGTSLTTLLDITADFDAFEIVIGCYNDNLGTSFSSFSGGIALYLDDNICLNLQAGHIGSSWTSFTMSKDKIFKAINGKNIKIKSASPHNINRFYYSIRKLNLKA